MEKDDEMMTNQQKLESDISINDQLQQDNNSYMDQGHGSSGFDSSMIMQNPNVSYDFMSQLASSGLAGMAAAAAISTSQRKCMLYSFESVPALRKRHSTRILRKIQLLVDEFAVRVGQQACLVVCSPKSAYKSVSEGPTSTHNVHFKVFGASPLDNVIRNLKDVIVNDLEVSLQNSQLANNNSSFFGNNPFDVLPPLMVDGIPTPLDKMTQAQLRAFIPVMLKYSTGRTKPAWGRSISRPPWWPDDVPWANVRSDVRTDEEKQRQSWTNALRKVVRCCYEYHGKAHLLFEYNPDALSLTMGDPYDSSGRHMSQGYGYADSIDQTTQARYSGRHMLINEQETVEAQLRAIQHYNIGGNGDGHIASMHMEGQRNPQVFNDYGSMGVDQCMLPESHHVKMEPFAMNHTSVMQLDSNSDLFRTNIQTAQQGSISTKKDQYGMNHGETVDIRGSRRNSPMCPSRENMDGSK